MSKSFEINVPLLNPNEPEVQVVVHVSEGQLVKPGDLLFTFETTKSTNELHADQEGYIAGLLFLDSGLAHATERLCWIAPDPSISANVKVSPDLIKMNGLTFQP